MIRDITIGQYYPANSRIHRLDPRVKIVCTLLYLISLFMFKSIIGYLLATLFLVCVVRLSTVPVKYILKGLKPIIMLLMITVLFNLFLTPGGRLLFHFGPLKITEQGLNTAVYMAIRLIYLIMGSSLMTLTTTPNALTDGLESLLSNVTQIGYITGHEELSRTDENGAKNFNQIISGMYELVDIDLKESEIPLGMNSIMINGPKTDFDENELYKIDQFIMRGGNVLFFVDSMVENQMASYTGGEQFTPNSINLDKLLQKYGVSRDLNMVFDKNCYVNQSSSYGKLNLYWAPVLQKNQLLKHPVTQNLGYVIMLQNGSLDVSAANENPDVKVSVLAKSSDESWAKESNIMLNPMYLNPPSAPSALKAYNLAVLLEGKFESAFDKAPDIIQKDENGNEIVMPQGDLSASNHINSSVLPGKIFVTGSSAVTTRQVIDESGTTPIAMFMMNVIDYLNGNEDLCTMRTKGLSVDTLTIKSQAAANFWKFFNQYGLVVILLLAGLFVWKARSKRRREINKKYNPNDSRTINKK